MAASQKLPELRSLLLKGSEVFALIISNEFPDYNAYHDLDLKTRGLENRYRRGAEDDLRRLQTMLTSDLACPPSNITLARNCNEQELYRHIEQFCSVAGSAKCLLIFAASHGTREFFITNTTVKEVESGQDGAIPLHYIWQPIVDRFGGQKPIAFFFQCCRGELRDSGRVVRAEKKTPNPATRSSNSSRMDTKTITPGRTMDLAMAEQPDVLFAFATVEDYVSYRFLTSEQEVGSFFLTFLCEAVRTRREKNEDLVRLLTRVSRQVAAQAIPNPNPEVPIKVKQCISLQSTLTLKIYFT